MTGYHRYTYQTEPWKRPLILTILFGDFSPYSKYATEVWLT
jgi:hypothetical protein